MTGTVSGKDSPLIMDNVHTVTGKRIILGVSGGIAAYKAAVLLRRLTEAGNRVTVIPTDAALRMVGKATWEALSGNSVSADVFDGADRVNHVRLGQEADLCLVVPATADTIAKMAHGIADNLLLTTLLSVSCPVAVAPAMHTQMWNNPATRHNIDLLRGRGTVILGPVSGRLTGRDSGPGRMMEPEEIIRRISALPDGKIHGADLRGKTVLISGGGTREPIDPVRFIGNRSSGRMAAELARSAALRGGKTILVNANTEAEILRSLPGSVRSVPVQTAAELAREMQKYAACADIVIMAAAVCDYRAQCAGDAKIKRGKDPITLTLVPNPDILLDLAENRRREKQLVVGFAAETGSAGKDFLQLGREKARRKKADFLAVNLVGEEQGFGPVKTELFLLDREGRERTRFSGEKSTVARDMMEFLAKNLYPAENRP